MPDDIPMELFNMALEVQSKKQRLEIELESLKQQLRELSQGNRIVHSVTGLGSVRVSQKVLTRYELVPAQLEQMPRDEFIWLMESEVVTKKLRERAFMALSEDKRNRLLDLECVTQVNNDQGVRKQTVTIRLEPPDDLETESINTGIEKHVRSTRPARVLAAKEYWRPQEPPNWFEIVQVAKLGDEENAYKAAYMAGYKAGYKLGHGEEREDYDRGYDEGYADAQNDINAGVDEDEENNVEDLAPF